MAVRMVHPDLPGQPADVPASAVPHHRAAGWQVEEGQAEQGESFPPEAGRFEGQAEVTLYHPALDAETVVPESAVPHWRGLGWLRPGIDEPQASPEIPAPDDLDSLTVADLQDALRARGLPTSGVKAELVERIRSASKAAPEDDRP